MSCDVGEETEKLESELCCMYVWALLILQPFCHFTYITTHSPTLPSLYLRQSSFSNPSVASSTSQFILQPFFCFSYITSSSLNSWGEPSMVCVCVCLCVGWGVWLWLWVCVCVCVYMHVCVCVRACVCMCMFVCVQAWALGQKPWWNWYLTAVVNFGEVWRAQLAKSTLLTSSPCPWDLFRSFKCAGAQFLFVCHCKRVHLEGRGFPEIIALSLCTSCCRSLEIVLLSVVDDIRVFP